MDGQRIFNIADKIFKYRGLISLKYLHINTDKRRHYKTNFKSTEQFPSGCKYNHTMIQKDYKKQFLTQDIQMNPQLNKNNTPFLAVVG